MSWAKSGNIKGPAGTAATVAIGTTTTGAASSSAAVSNSGTSSAAVLNFVVPQGTAGTRGSVWTTGTGAPTSTTVQTGDMYLDTASGDVYQF